MGNSDLPGRTGLVVPYASLEDAARARRLVWWALAAVAAGYVVMVVFVVWGVVSDPLPSGSGGSSGSGFPGAGSAVGSLVFLAITLAYRRKLNEVAGRPLSRRELVLMGDATAAGVIVGEDDLVRVQEVATRGALSVRGGWVLALVLVPVLVLPPVWFLMLGMLAPAPFVVSGVLVVVGMGYASWSLLRRAAGAERVNFEFNAPLTVEEQSSVQDEPH